MDDLLGMFSQISTDDHTAMTQQFARVMQIDPQTSQFFLESSNWDVQLAINAFLSTAGHSEQMYQQHVAPQATLLTDVSALNNVQFPPLTPIAFTFSFRNSGQAAWPHDSRLVFVDGHRLGGPADLRVHPAAPGQQVDLPVQLQTPAEAGIYAGTWRLTCGSGYFSDPLWLVFTVVDEAGQQMTDALAKFGLSANQQANPAQQTNPFQAMPNQPMAGQPMQPVQPAQPPAAGGFFQQPTFAFQPSQMQPPQAQPQPQQAPPPAQPSQQQQGDMDM